MLQLFQFQAFKNQPEPTDPSLPEKAITPEPEEDELEQLTELEEKPKVSTSTVVSTDSVSPDVASKDVVVPNVVSPNVVSPDVASKDVMSQDEVSPDVVSTDVMLTDVVSIDATPEESGVSESDEVLMEATDSGR